MKRGFAVFILGFSGALTFVGCGGGSGNGTAPSQVNCEDYCERATQCAAEVCEEDVGRPIPSTLFDLLKTTCASVCTEQALRAGMDQSQWECLFESSCRQVLADDVCQVNATYACNY